MRMPAGYPAAIKRGKKDEDDDLDRDRQDGQADLDSGLKKQAVQKPTTSVLCFFRRLLTRSCNLINLSRLSAFAFLVVIANATRMGMFAFAGTVQ